MKATRFVRRKETVDIDIIEQSPLHGPATILWEQLKRKCVICRQPIKVGDMYHLTMYLENDKQYSGAAHQHCLKQQDETKLTTLNT